MNQLKDYIFLEYFYFSSNCIRNTNPLLFCLYAGKRGAVANIIRLFLVDVKAM
jgi:hypothetical protein